MTVNAKISTKNATKATKGAVAAARQAIIKARIQAVQQYLPTHAALFRPFGSIENRDAVAMMRDLPDAFVDSVVTDPPYGINMAAWDGKVPGVEVWREAYRVLKPGAFCVVAAAGRTYDETAQALRAAGFEVRDMLVWRYTQSFPASKGLGGEWRSGLKNNQEPWVVAQKPKERGLTLTQNWLIHCTGAVRTGAVGSGDWRSNVIHCAKPKPWERDLGCVPGKVYVQPTPPKSGARSNSSNGQNWHPTVKPLGLMRALVRLFTPDLGVVLDPFMGSGSTLVAAAAEGHAVFGADLCRGYWDMACDRVDWAYANPNKVPGAV